MSGTLHISALQSRSGSNTAVCKSGKIIAQSSGGGEDLGAESMSVQVNTFTTLKQGLAELLQPVLGCCSRFSLPFDR